MNDIDDLVGRVTSVMASAMQGEHTPEQDQQAAAAMVTLAALVIKDIRRIADALEKANEPFVTCATEEQVANEPAKRIATALEKLVEAGTGEHGINVSSKSV